MTGPSLSGQPRLVQSLRCRLDSTVGVAAGVYATGDGAPANPIAGASNQNQVRPFALELSEWEIYAKELLFMLEFRFVCGDVNPGVNVFASLFPITGMAGTVALPTLTAGAEIAGSRTPTRATVANAVSAPDQSGGFEVPAAGVYLIGLTISAGMAATSYISMLGRLAAYSR